MFFEFAVAGYQLNTIHIPDEELRFTFLSVHFCLDTKTNQKGQAFSTSF